MFRRLQSYAGFIPSKRKARKTEIQWGTFHLHKICKAKKRIGKGSMYILSRRELRGRVNIHVCLLARIRMLAGLVFDLMNRWYYRVRKFLFS